MSGEAIKPEYPRPRLRRDSYLNLNGEWAFCINHSPECASYDRVIRVPFPPEAPLSGVGIVAQPEDTLHYRRTFSLPEGFHRGRVLLHFGAVDQECEVWLNRIKVGGHRGGYLPFSMDITDALQKGENVLEVCARDYTEHAPYARGKQKLTRKGHMASIFYTPCSGIWKTVWLESVPERYITDLKLTPRVDSAQVEMFIRTNTPGQAEAEISFCGAAVWKGVLAANAPARIDLPELHLWSPDTPNLYDVNVRFGEDRVESYFGMRHFEARPDGSGIMRFFLNGEPFFFNGVLDQGYWPDGLLTAPSLDALRHDILTIKGLGYNTLRMHVKVEEETFYTLCDQLGMTVWQDMPNGGGEYNMTFVTYLPNGIEGFGRSIRDSHYRWFARQDAGGRAQYYEELEDMVRLLCSYPCIALWTPFNEGWGQFDAGAATERIRRIDPTRLINEACGWFDQGGGDLFSIHNYLRRLKVSPRPPRVVALTEYGGYACPIRGHTYNDKAFGYKKTCRSGEELTKRYEQLWDTEILPAIRNGLSAAIYTHVSDIEEEVNGIMTYDREIVKFQADTVRKLHARAFEEFDRTASSPSADTPER